MASPSEERRQSAVNVPINSNTEDESMDDDDDDMEFHESTDQSATDDTEEEMDGEGYYGKGSSGQRPPSPAHVSVWLQMPRKGT